jgi:hypothetical protein
MAPHLIQISLAKATLLPSPEQLPIAQSCLMDVPRKQALKAAYGQQMGSCRVWFMWARIVVDRREKQTAQIRNLHTARPFTAISI